MTDADGFEIWYACGGCGYDRVAPWSTHRAHYESHAEGELAWARQRWGVIGQS